jgi:hypothetical protein
LTRENVEKQDKTITQNTLEKDDRYRTYTSIQPKSIDNTGKNKVGQYRQEQPRQGLSRQEQQRQGLSGQEQD